MNRSIAGTLLLAAILALPGCRRKPVTPPAAAKTKPAAATTRPTTRPVKIKITIGKDTTYITGPVNADGTVNYVAYINARHSKGVTPQNNAAVILARAIGPELWRKHVRARAFKAMGMAVPPADGDYFVPLDDYVEGLPEKDQPTLTKTAEQKAADKRREELGAKLLAKSLFGGKAPTEIFDELDKLLPPREIGDVASDQLDETMRGPWSAKQYPIIAGWLAANVKPLAVMTNATKRSRFYLPLISRSVPPQILDARGPSCTGPMETAKALTARAMLRLRGGDDAGAWADLMAARRLGRLVGRGSTILEALVGTAMAACADDGCRAFITRDKLPAALLRSCRNDLAAQATWPDIRNAIANDRFDTLDSAMMLARGRKDEVGGMLEIFYGLKPNRLTRWATEEIRSHIDWNEVLRDQNRWFDMMYRAQSVTDVRKRREALAKVDREFEKVSRRHSARLTPVGLVRSFAPALIQTYHFRQKRITLYISEFLASMATSSMGYLLDRQDHIRTSSEILLVATGLALCEAETGFFPAKLAELAPKYLKAVPRDRFSGKALVYRLAGRGCVVYSVGMNLKDDGGIDNTKDEDVEPENKKDDIVIRFKR